MGTLNKRPKLSLLRLGLYLGAACGACLLLSLGVGWLFGNRLLNRYGKSRAEQALARALPGCRLQIGHLDYSLGANCLVAHSVRLATEHSTLELESLALRGLRLRRLLWGAASAQEVLAAAQLDATNLTLSLPQAHYKLRCQRLRGSVPESQLLAQSIELLTLAGDDDFFGASAFRRSRFHVLLPECRVEGLAWAELLQGKAYRAREVSLSGPSLDILVSRYKPPEEVQTPPRMVAEALAAIARPVQLERLSISRGNLLYGERAVSGAAPGVLSFGSVELLADGISNRPQGSAAIQLQAQARFMEEATLKLVLAVPLVAPGLSLHLSGSLGPMELSRLNAFLEPAEHTRVKSGHALETTFEVQVRDGHASGRVRALYSELEIAFLDKQTDSEAGAANRLASFFTNLLKIRNSNGPDASGAIRDGTVGYTHKPEEEFVKFLWFALRSGVLDAISL